MLKTLAVCVAVAVTLFGVIHANDLILGNILPGDRIMHSQVYIAPGIVNQTISRIVSHSGVTNITAVRAYDRSLYRSGVATLTHGGPGYVNVSVRIQGAYSGAGYDFLFEVYGR
ncbi:probable salivary secreted peptide [Uranotaenia lowii]|uniref:probable salivary secreted peptide n=1 Tax=Uranotaenia lowii TaxID=190385 RepID=UPI0024797671|nr:probable salivary secreted peptide [Uranotaenia lowii]